MNIEKDIKPSDLNLSVLQASYDAQYETMDIEWREKNGYYKAKNIEEICKGRDFKNTLDVGSGDGSVLYWMDKSGFITGLYSLEISNSGIERIKKRSIKSLKEVKKFNGYSIPYPDKNFELVTCSHVMEHVEHPRLLLREIGRVSDFQCFEIPIDFSFFVDKKLNHFLAYGHVNIFTPSLFKFLLKSEGFDIIKEKFLFYPKETRKMVYKNPRTYWVNSLKNFVVESIPFLRKIKPNAYIVLCKKNKENLAIF